MKSSSKQSEKSQSTYVRVPGRDAHTASQCQVKTAKEGAQSKGGKKK
jgi:hypothetical protein